MDLNPSLGKLFNSSEFPFPYLKKGSPCRVVEKLEIIYVSIRHYACHIRVSVNIKRGQMEKKIIKAKIKSWGTREGACNSDDRVRISVTVGDSEL